MLTDKPLDCVGIDPALSKVGKHDFRECPPLPVTPTRPGFQPSGKKEES